MFKHAYTSKKVTPQAVAEAKLDESDASYSAPAPTQPVEAGLPPETEQTPTRVVEGLNIEAVKRVLLLAASAATTQA